MDTAKKTDKAKCLCKLHIIGHGQDNGGLVFPYQVIFPDESSPWQGDTNVLGGTSGATDELKVYRKPFEEFTKSIKKAMCNKKDVTITFHSCWSADPDNPDHHIAQAVANELKVTTRGYTDCVEFPVVVLVGPGGARGAIIDADPPRPSAGSELKTFTPAKNKKDK